MKANAFYSMLARSLGAFVLCCPLLVGLAHAQDTDEQVGASDAERERVTIIIEADGRVTVNGEEVERDDSGVLRLDNGSGDLVIVRPEPGFRFHLNESGAFDEDMVQESIRKLAEKSYWRTLPFENFEPFLGEAAFIARQSAETMELEREAHALARRAREAEGAERQRLERELRDKLSEALDAKLKTRSERIERLEEQLNEERNALETRRNSRDEIIDRRLRELLGEDDILDW